MQLILNIPYISFGADRYNHFDNRNLRSSRRAYRVEKNIHKSSLIASVGFAVGVAGTGLVVRLHSMALILICYGVIMGIGLGLGYLSPVKTFMKDRNNVYKIILISALAISALALATGAISNELIVICIALVILVNLGYDSEFSNLPTLLSDVYGMGKISSLHGIALSAWAFGGLTGTKSPI